MLSYAHELLLGYVRSKNGRSILLDPVDVEVRAVFNFDVKGVSVSRQIETFFECLMETECLVSV